MRGRRLHANMLAQPKGRRKREFPTQLAVSAAFSLGLTG
jgi:hypothetical protein